MPLASYRGKGEASRRPGSFSIYRPSASQAGTDRAHHGTKYVPESRSQHAPQPDP